jgi:hypothetical protein
MPWHSCDQYIMLPDGTVRRPLDMQDWLFWKTWGHILLRWWQVHETFLEGRRVSTTFLGLDHDSGVGWDWEAGPDGIPHPVFPDGYLPVLYETMVFPYAVKFGTVDRVQLRARTRVDAKRNHHAVVCKVAGKGAFVCPDCFAVSYHPEDLSNRYCGRCHEFKPAP